MSRNNRFIYLSYKIRYMMWQAIGGRTLLPFITDRNMLVGRDVRGGGLFVFIPAQNFV